MLVIGCLSIAGLSDKSFASTIGGVGASRVNNGALVSELRVGYSEDKENSPQDERLRSRIQLDYGFTPHYALRLLVAQDTRKNTATQHESVMIDNRFHLLDAVDYGFDFGVRAFYVFNKGDSKPDRLGVRFIEVVKLRDWELRFNQFLQHDVGTGRVPGLLFESRVQATTQLNARHRWGLESFNNFGRLRDLSGYSNQSHAVGLVLKGKIGGLGYETGYRVGVSEGAVDHSFKLFFKKTF